jgi:hypothetical protein
MNTRKNKREAIAQGRPRLLYVRKEMIWRAKFIGKLLLYRRASEKWKVKGQNEGSFILRTNHFLSR